MHSLIVKITVNGIVEITVNSILSCYPHGTENHWEKCGWYSFSIFSSRVLNWHHGVVIYPAEVSILLGCGATSLSDWWPVFWYPVFSQNFRHHIHSDMTPHPRRMKTSTVPPWKCKKLVYLLCCLLWRLAYFCHFTSKWKASAENIGHHCGCYSERDFSMNLLVHIISPDETCHNCKLLNWTCDTVLQLRGHYSAWEDSDTSASSWWRVWYYLWTFSC